MLPAGASTRCSATLCASPSCGLIIVAAQSAFQSACGVGRVNAQLAVYFQVMPPASVQAKAAVAVALRSPVLRTFAGVTASLAGARFSSTEPTS